MVLFLGAIPFFVHAQVPNDARYDELWYLPHIDAPDAWDSTTGSDEVIVAILDTGVDLDHPDLEENIWMNSKEIAGNDRDDDRNGFVDDVYGWDFVDEDKDPSPVFTRRGSVDALSHGTVIAGIVAAKGDNVIGTVGITWNTKIMALRMLNEEGSGTEEWAAAAIDYAVKNGADVINLSFAGDESHSMLRTAVHRAYDAGVVVVAALGNEARNVNERPVYPACLRDGSQDWVIGVAATDEDDRESDFTNYGSRCADISAPGENIFGLGYSTSTNPDNESLYSGPWSGTSAASPIVAGTVALLLSEYPDLTPYEVRSALRLSVDPVDETSGSGSIGAGRVNVARALAAAESYGTDTGDENTSPSDIATDDEEIADQEDSTSSDNDTYLDGAKYSFMALGAQKGSAPNVVVWRADGTLYTTFAAYASTFTGGVHVAIDDLDNDNVPEIVTGTGKGGGPHIRLFTVSGALIREFFAFDPASREGVSVGLGDVDGDDIEEVVTVVGGGVSDDVVIFDQKGNEVSRFTVSGFTLGTHYGVAVADVDDDWESEIIVYALEGESRVAVYDNDGTHLVDFLAFAELVSGVSVAAGDFDGDARDEIVVSPVEGTNGLVRIFNKVGAWWGGFAVEGGAINVAVSDIDVDGDKDIVTAPVSSNGSIIVQDSSGSALYKISDAVTVGGAFLGAW